MSDDTPLDTAVPVGISKADLVRQLISYASRAHYFINALVPDENDDVDIDWTVVGRLVDQGDDIHLALVELASESMSSCLEVLG